jgi:hypothetical protein
MNAPMTPQMRAQMQQLEQKQRLLEQNKQAALVQLRIIQSMLAQKPVAR